MHSRSRRLIILGLVLGALATAGIIGSHAWMFGLWIKVAVLRLKGFPVWPVRSIEAAGQSLSYKGGLGSPYVLISPSGEVVAEVSKWDCSIERYPGDSVRGNGQIPQSNPFWRRREVYLPIGTNQGQWINHPLAIANAEGDDIAKLICFFSKGSAVLSGIILAAGIKSLVFRNWRRGRAGPSAEGGQ